MSKKKTNPTIKIAALITVAAIVGVGVISAVSGGSDSEKNQANAMLNQNGNSVSDGATGDTPVETLKTLTATVSNVQVQNQKVIASQKQAQQKTSSQIESFEQQINQKLTDALSKMQSSSQNTQDKVSYALQQIDKKKSGYQYKLDGGSAATHNFVWVSDLQSQYDDSATTTASNSHGSGFNGLLNQGDQSSLSTSQSSESNTTDGKPKPIPYYTIPVNSTLTGVIAMQPILGKVPIDNRVVDPYHFKMMLGPKNLAASGIDIPSNIQGIVASGIAQGSLIGPINKQACVRGSITSMTFIFADGRISTTQAKGGQSLGSISDDRGFPCISGVLETNAPEYLGITFGLGALQGYAQGMSQSQLDNSTTSTGGSLSTLVGSYSKYAFGQAASSGAEAVQNWFNQRMQNSTDLVVVPNYDSATHSYKHFNINISQQIDIDYNSQNRKVSYEHQGNPYSSATLD